MKNHSKINGEKDRQRQRKVSSTCSSSPGRGRSENFWFFLVTPRTYWHSFGSAGSWLLLGLLGTVTIRFGSAEFAK